MTEWIFPFRQFVIISFLALAFITVFFSVSTGTPTLSTAIFFAAVAMLAYFPGKMLVDWGGFDLQPIEDLTLSLISGAIASAIVYALFVLLKAGLLFPLWPLAVTAVFLYRERQNWPRVPDLHISVHGYHLLLSGVIVLGSLPFHVLPLWRQSSAPLLEKDMLVPVIPDVILHLSISNELLHTFPPQVPFLAGTPMNYHYGMDLLAAMFSASTGLGVADILIRLMPSLYIVGAVLAIFCFSRNWLRNGSAAALVALLVILGEDFSFIPGFLLDAKEVWSDYFFHVPSTFSLYFLTPMLPAMSLLFIALFCLTKHSQEGRTNWAIWAAFLFGVLIEFKIFAAAQILSALTATAIIYWLMHRDTRWLMMLALSLLVMVPLLLYVWIENAAIAGQSFAIRPYPYLSTALQAMGFSNTPVGYSVSAIYNFREVTLSSLVALLLIALPWYLLGSLGLRILAIPVMVKQLATSLKMERFFLAAFTLLGLLITLTCRLTLDNGGYNNAVWFFVQSKYVAWVFVVELMMILFRGKGRIFQTFAISVLIALSVPSTIQYFSWQMTLQPQVTVDKNTAHAIDYLGKICVRGEVVFSRAELAKDIVAMTKCRVPYAGIVDRSFLTALQINHRLKDQNDFWDTNTGNDQRREILKRYNSEYLIIAQAAGGSLERIGYTSAVPVFENQGLAIYKVLREESQVDIR